MTAPTFRQDDRVFDYRKPHIAGRCLADSDPITKLVRVQWDGGSKTSLVVVTVLKLEEKVA